MPFDPKKLRDKRVNAAGSTITAGELRPLLAECNVAIRPVITSNFEGEGGNWRRSGIGWCGKGLKKIASRFPELLDGHPCRIEGFNITAASLYGDLRYLYLLVEPAAQDAKPKPTDLLTLLDE